MRNGYAPVTVKTTAGPVTPQRPKLRARASGSLGTRTVRACTASGGGREGVRLRYGPACPSLVEGQLALAGLWMAHIRRAGHRPSVSWRGDPYVGRVRPMRLTHALVQVALALVDDPDRRHWGYELSKHAGIRSGVLYPILHRMLDEGWLEDGWEEQDRIAGKRPPRRYYKLTEQGAVELGAVLQAARNEARFKALVARFS
jgi:PadR family transcriptional regulator, regulatory protein PadR